MAGRKDCWHEKSYSGGSVFLFLLSFISTLLKQNEELYLSTLLMSVDTNHKLGKKIKGGGGVLGMMIITS